MSAQTVQPVAQQTSPEAQVPLYSITVVGKSVDAVNYHTLGRQTKILFEGTPLLPAAKGSAEVEVIRGATRIEADFRDVAPAQRFGPEYLTYVLWAITPDGRATNLGEVQLRGTSSKLNVTTPLQNFGLVVTAEPYFAVTRPGDLVVMQNLIRPETVGAIHPIQARYGLLQRGQYTRTIPRGEVTLLPQDPKVPLDYYEAENAVRIARWAGAAQYAPDIFARAEQQLQQAQGYLARNAGRKPVATISRSAVQAAEDARLLALNRQQQEAEARRHQAERERIAAAQAAEQTARQQSEHAQAMRAEAEARQQQAQLQQQQSQAAATQARQAAQQAQLQQQQAQAQQQQAEAAAAQARQAEQQARLQQQQAEQQALQLRARLQQQLNQVFQTRNTARGLIVSMSDVLFDFDRSTLRSSAQLKLAKVSGILLAHPDLKIGVEGYTDNIGTPEYNMRLSRDRADAVENFLLQQGVASANVVAQGFGASDPVAPNSTPAGRQQNRRVQLVVSGASIGSPEATPPAP